MLYVLSCFAWFTTGLALGVMGYVVGRLIAKWVIRAAVSKRR